MLQNFNRTKIIPGILNPKAAIASLKMKIGTPQFYRTSNQTIKVIIADIQFNIGFNLIKLN